MVISHIQRIIPTTNLSQVTRKLLDFTVPPPCKKHKATDKEKRCGEGEERRIKGESERSEPRGEHNNTGKNEHKKPNFSITPQLNHPPYTLNHGQF